MSDHSSDTVSAWSPTVIIVQTPTEPPLIPSIMSFHSSMPTLISETISNLSDESIFNSDSFSEVTEVDFANYSPFQEHHYSSQIVLPSSLFLERIQSLNLPIYSFTEIFLNLKTTICFEPILTPAYIYLKADLIFQNIAPIPNLYFHFPEVTYSWDDWESLRGG